LTARRRSPQTGFPVVIQSAAKNERKNEHPRSRRRKLAVISTEQQQENSLNTCIVDCKRKVDATLWSCETDADGEAEAVNVAVLAAVVLNLA